MTHQNLIARPITLPLPAVVLDEGGACATIIGGAFWDPNSKTLQCVLKHIIIGI